MPITLKNVAGNFTLQAADANSNAWNIALSGPLSGLGGLVKSGGGILTLSGTNTYGGTTAISAGFLTLSTASTGGGAYSVASNAVLTVQVANLGSSLHMATLTLNGGAALSLNPNTYGSLTAPIINVGTATLTPAATVTINFDASTLPSGQFPADQVWTTLGGAGFNAFALGVVTLPAGSGDSATLVNNTTNQSIDLSVTAGSQPPLKWDGTVNGNWDINVTPNWQVNAYYTQTNGAGPEVIFDDTASGPYTAIILNTLVSPAAVVVSNSVLNYSINGTGGLTGPGALLKVGAGDLALGGNNSFQGGTTIDQGTLALGPTNNVEMAYTINGGTLNLGVDVPEILRWK